MYEMCTKCMKKYTKREVPLFPLSLFHSFPNINSNFSYFLYLSSISLYRCIQIYANMQMNSVEC